MGGVSVTDATRRILKDMLEDGAVSMSQTAGKLCSLWTSMIHGCICSASDHFVTTDIAASLLHAGALLYCSGRGIICMGSIKAKASFFVTGAPMLHP